MEVCTEHLDPLNVVGPENEGKTVMSSYYSFIHSHIIRLEFIFGSSTIKICLIQHNIKQKVKVTDGT